jgi:hypothetical protein
MILWQQLGPFWWRCAMHEGGVYREAHGSTKWEAGRRLASARRRQQELGGCKGEK